MSYELGVDLGTTFSAAAVHRDGRATISSLGRRAPTIPSVVFIRDDDTFLTGDAAERRAATEPERIVREFKRRLGDPTPLIVAGAPHSPESLTAKLLADMVAAVAQTEGGPPDQIVVTHPANWGRYKVELLTEAVTLAGLDLSNVSFITEPEAAAVSYAAQERVDPGEIVAVYDLGGGTFDAAVLRRTDNGFSLVGRPEGIERLGGIDFDAAVFSHVTMSLGDVFANIDPEDPAALAAVARLRRDCVDAKEALSSDTDATIPVLLPNHQTEVRITRGEFESLIRPVLMDSIGAMRRAVNSAGLQLDDVSRILLVGGSSRIPLVSLLISSELARPVAVDTHPKHTVAIGAAYAAGGLLEQARQVAPGLEGGIAPGDGGRAAGVGVDPKLSAAEAGMTRVSDNPPPLIPPRPDEGPPQGVPRENTWFEPNKPAAEPGPTPVGQPAVPRPAPPSPVPGSAKARPVQAPPNPPPVSPPGGNRPPPVDRPATPPPSAPPEFSPPPSAAPRPAPDPAPSPGPRQPQKARRVTAPGPPPPGGIDARPQRAPRPAQPGPDRPPNPNVAQPRRQGPEFEPTAARPPGAPPNAGPSGRSTPQPGVGSPASSGSSSGSSAVRWVLLAIVIVGALGGAAVALGLVP